MGGRHTTCGLCADCHRMKPVMTRLESGKPLCPVCAGRRNAEVCIECGGLKRVGYRTDDGKPICLNCGRKHKPEVCSDCGNLRPVSIRVNGHPLCGRCYLWSSPEIIYRQYRKEANRRSVMFSVSQQEFIACVQQPCHYCGRSYHIGVDRKNSDHRVS